MRLDPYLELLECINVHRDRPDSAHTSHADMLADIAQIDKHIIIRPTIKILNPLLQNGSQVLKPNTRGHHCHSYQDSINAFDHLNKIQQIFTILREKTLKRRRYSAVFDSESHLTLKISFPT